VNAAAQNPPSLFKLKHHALVALLHTLHVPSQPMLLHAAMQLHALGWCSRHASAVLTS
jgi:hypothetical protein